MKRDRQEERDRLNFALPQLIDKGVEIVRVTDSEIQFIYLKKLVKYYPYTGWHTGKSIKDGRGLRKLLDQLHDQPL